MFAEVFVLFLRKQVLDGGTVHKLVRDRGGERAGVCSALCVVVVLCVACVQLVRAALDSVVSLADTGSQGSQACVLRGASGEGIGLK